MITSTGQALCVHRVMMMWWSESSKEGGARTYTSLFKVSPTVLTALHHHHHTDAFFHARTHPLSPSHVVWKSRPYFTPAGLAKPRRPAAAARGLWGGLGVGVRARVHARRRQQPQPKHTSQRAAPAQLQTHRHALDPGLFDARCPLHPIVIPMGDRPPIHAAHPRTQTTARQSTHRASWRTNMAGKGVRVAAVPVFVGAVGWW